MAKKPLGIATVALALSVSACLQKETTHTLYLSPDGAVSWVAIEKDVRSDEIDPAKRLNEEQAYLTGAMNGTNDLALGLAALVPRRLETTILRRQRPYFVMTEADFDRVDRIVGLILAELGTPGSVALTHDGSWTTLAVRIDLSKAASGEDTPSTPMAALFEEPARYRIVLTDGHFIGASGFTVIDGGTTATFIERSHDDVIANGGVIELMLTWDSAPTSGPRTSSDRSSR